MPLLLYHSADRVQATHDDHRPHVRSQAAGRPRGAHLPMRIGLARETDERAHPAELLE